MKKNQLELLAPAGSYDIFKAVLNAGADAVYVGGSQFGARAYANNFSKEELLLAIDEAHIHGKQLYLTVNTLLKEDELETQLYDYLLPYYEQGSISVYPGTFSENGYSYQHADDNLQPLWRRDDERAWR